jgi:hypothetical protein
MAHTPRSYVKQPELAEGTPPRWYTYYSTDEAGNIYSAPLYTTELFFSCYTSAPGRAAGSSRRRFVTQAQAAYQRLKDAPAPPRSYGNDSNFLKVRRRESYLATVQIKPEVFTLLHCKSSGWPFSFCESVAAPRNGLGPMIMYLRRATSGATGNVSAWAPRPSTCDAHRLAPRATAWPMSKITDLPFRLKRPAFALF